MTFHSILFQKTEDSIEKETSEAPDFFVDLNLNQVIDAIVVGRQEYNLKPFFYLPLSDIDAILYRQEILQDLENELLYACIQAFAQNMRTMREYLIQAGKLYYHYQKKRWFLDAVEMYCDAVVRLAHDISLIALQSQGFLAFRGYVTDYVNSIRFTSVLMKTKKLKTDLSTVHYCIRIKDNHVKVSTYEAEIDYSADVEETFAKFKQEIAKDYRVKFSALLDMDHVEAQILDMVVNLYPDIFFDLDDYCEKNAHYLDGTLATFDREIQFYIAYVEYVTDLKRRGLKFCYPHISTTSKEVFDYEGFDVALAYKLATENSPIVCNDFFLKGNERIIVVTGPNQGGKTTFARTFGQLHYLASIGCLVPGREAQLFLFDRLFTHFEKEESIKDLRGKLQDDLVRIDDILTQATSNSIILMNEIFTSTTVQDAVFLGQKVLGKILQLDVLGIFVTFLDELASFSEKTVSMVSTVVPENLAPRTYTIVRRPADGLAYALAVAEKYRLTYESVKERLQS
jgi:DNA mismatch repair ATPase MutS